MMLMAENVEHRPIPPTPVLLGAVQDIKEGGEQIAEICFGGRVDRPCIKISPTAHWLGVYLTHSRFL